jgi:hypothetical protein
METFDPGGGRALMFTEAWLHAAQRGRIWHQQDAPAEHNALLLILAILDVALAIKRSYRTFLATDFNGGKSGCIHCWRHRQTPRTGVWSWGGRVLNLNLLPFVEGT